MDKEIRLYLEGELTLQANGKWFHQGQEITNQKISDLFHRSIIKDPESGYRIKIRYFSASFKIEQVPFFIATIYETENELKAVLLGGKEAKLDLTTLSLKDSELFCDFDSNTAKFLTAAYQLLVQYLISSDTIEFKGKQYPIKNADGI